MNDTAMNLKVWQERMGNLMSRRSLSVNLNKRLFNNPAADYCGHMKKLHPGQSVLDVGCGDQSLKRYLPRECQYVGLDPFPCVPGTVKGMIEEFDTKLRFDTILCFAALDGVCSLGLALATINRLATKNIGILTGIDIEPDKFHTFKITFELLEFGLPDFKIGLKHEICPKTWLLEYNRKEK